MIHIVLWFNMIAFSLLLSGLGTEFLAWLRRREAWRSLYMAYAAMYGVFMLFQTFEYFNRFYLEPPMTWLDAAFGLFQPAVSIAMLAIIPVYYAKATDLRLAGLRRLGLFAPAALTLAGIAALLAGAPVQIGAGLNISFNALIAAISMLGLRRVAQGHAAAPKADILPFFVLSACLYAFLAALGIVMVSGLLPQASPLISVGAAGLFGFSWGILLLVSALRRSAPRDTADKSSHIAFAADYDFSPREAEVLGLLIEGLTSRQIAERLFISARTVETHVYNIYRKCGCRNKVELLTKAQSYVATT